MPRISPFSVILRGGRPFALAAALALGAAGPACAERGPRPLVLADGSAQAHQGEVAARVAAFQAARGRQVRVIRAERPAEAVQLASRGDVDVALVEASHPIGDFIAAKHGREAGTLVISGAPLRVLEVNAVAHPKVDAEGARSLAAALVSPP